MYFTNRQICFPQMKKRKSQLKKKTVKRKIIPLSYGQKMLLASTSRDLNKEKENEEPDPGTRMNSRTLVRVWLESNNRIQNPENSFTYDSGISGGSHMFLWLGIFLS